MAADSASQLRTEVSRARARIQIHRSELETIKRRLELARKDKRETERVELDGARRQKEAEIRMLERVHALSEDERYSHAVGLQTFFAVPPRPGPAWRSWLLTVGWKRGSS